jgi:hypothetical protein
MEYNMHFILRQYEGLWYWNLDGYEWDLVHGPFPSEEEANQDITKFVDRCVKKFRRFGFPGGNIILVDTLREEGNE